MLSHVGEFGIFQIGHEHIGARIQRVDDHLAIHWSRDFRPPIHEVARNGRDSPLGGANVRGLWQKIGKLAGIDELLPCRTLREQLQAPCIELAVQRGDKSDGFRGQNRGVLGGHGGIDHNIFSHR